MRLEKADSESRLHSKNRLCCERSVPTLATENVPPQQSATTPTGRVKLRMMSFFHTMFLYPGQSKCLELNAPNQPESIVHLAVDVGRWLAHVSILDVSNLCSRTRRCTRVQALY